MDIFSLPPIAALFGAAYRAMLALIELLSPVAGTAAAALAIVLVTVLVRTVLIPVGVSQARAAQTRARLTPQLQELQRRYAKNPERLQRELTQLYKRENASPFAGCLPLLIQAPVVGLIYSLFIHPLVNGVPNALLTAQLWNVPLGTSLLGEIGRGTVDGSTMAVVGLIVGVLVIAGELTRRLLPALPPSTAAATSTGMHAVLGGLQFVTAIIAMFVPISAGIYLAVTMSWTLAQRLILARAFPTVSSGTARE